MAEMQFFEYGVVLDSCGNTETLREVCIAPAKVKRTI